VIFMNFFSMKPSSKTILGNEVYFQYGEMP